MKKSEAIEYIAKFNLEHNDRLSKAYTSFRIGDWDEIDPRIKDLYILKAKAMLEFIENDLGMQPPPRKDLDPFDNEACSLIGKGYVWEDE